MLLCNYVITNTNYNVLTSVLACWYLINMDVNVSGLHALPAGAPRSQNIREE